MNFIENLRHRYKESVEVDMEPAQKRRKHNADMAADMAEVPASEGGKNDAFFLRSICMEERKACYSHFYEATSNAALASSVCGVCARERFKVADGVVDIPLSAIPNAKRLVPTRSHPKHDLFDGKLLHPRGVHVAEETVYVCVCGSNCGLGTFHGY